MVLTVSEAAPLTLTLFGPMQVLVSGKTIPHLRSRKSLWMLALLTLRHGRAVEREWLAGTLWPDMDPSQALANLRTVLSEMRQALGSESRRLESPNRQTLRLELAGADVDLLAFDTAMASKNLSGLERAVALYQGPLLEGCTEEWVGQERGAREQDCLHALQTLADSALRGGDQETASGLYRRAISLDPWREAAQRGLMEALARGGDTNAALQVYRTFLDLLRTDPKAVPAPETSALYTRLRAEARRQAVPLSTALPETAAITASTPIVTGYLPHALTDLVGRDDERLEVAAKLRRSRLVTLTGPGGIGKTRLAIEVATDVVQDYPGGVWLVALDALSDENQVPGQIAGVLGVKEEASRPLLESIAAHLGTQRLLLVLDNCEHLIEASAQIAGHLLQKCMGVRVLATSREALGITGEIAWQVPALAVPDPEHLPAGRVTIVRVLSGYESIQLFVERTQGIQKTFALTAENAPSVAQICARLGGHPLALELAAARVKVLTVAKIAARLDDHLSLLTGGSRVAQSRQQTLRATLDWSYSLLTEPEQVLLGRLSVFAGGWTLEAAEDVCAEDNVETGQVLDLLSSLVDKSLAVFEDRTGGKNGRYRFLEMMRQYAAERLVASGDADRIKTRHQEYFLAFALARDQLLPRTTHPHALQEMEAERDNLRAALVWEGPEPHGANTGLKLVITLWRFWDIRGDYTEGRSYLRRTLERAGEQAAPDLRARALNTEGCAAYYQSDYDTAQTRFVEALEIRRDLDDPLDIAESLSNLGNVSYSRDDYAAARTLYEEALTIQRALDDRQGIAMTLGNLGNTVCYSEPALARTFFEESLHHYRELGNQTGILWILGILSSLAHSQHDFQLAQSLAAESLSLAQESGNKAGAAEALSRLGDVSLAQDDLAMAQAHYEESLRLFTEIGERSLGTWALIGLAHVAQGRHDLGTAQSLFEQSRRRFAEVGGRRGEGWAICSLGKVAQTQGDLSSAQVLYRESLTIFQAIGDRENIVVNLGGLASTLLEQENARQAAFLWGAAEAIRDSLGGSIAPKEREKYDQQLSQARVALGEDIFTAAWAEGHAMTEDQAVAFALEETNSPG